MDESDPDIVFDDDGVCNHCLTYDREFSKRVYRGAEGQRRLRAVVDEIKAAGRGKPYDCIIGVSGGVDSTYVAYLTKQLGLRPLAVHFDNGWNSELAVSNIEKTLQTLSIDLHTFVIDWAEFRSLQLAFLKAATPDGEIPTDHAINALLFHEAAKRGIRYIISGMNYATESSSVPAWAYGHMDWRYVRAINRLFGTKRLKQYPHIGLIELAWFSVIRRIKVVAILNYVDYNKAAALKILEKDLGWRYYGGKHYESVYTRFYQGFILPTKYNIDKRIAHLSALINSGQLSREAALEEIAENAYVTNGLAAEDRAYTIKKFGLSADEFDALMARPNRTFRDYPNAYGLVSRIKRLVNFLRKRDLLAR
jgi:N-acetyl sugar amidotransferase